VALREARKDGESLADVRVVSARLSGCLLVLGVVVLATPAGAVSSTPDSIRTLRAAQGWYPPADPESASVRLGRRAAKPVDMPFSGGRPSLEELAQAIVAHVSTNVPDSLLGLCVTKGEFEAILWPEMPQSRPATGLLPIDGWRVLQNRLVSGTRGAAADWGGQPWTLVRVEAGAGVTHFTNYDLHRGIVLVVKDEAGTERRMDFLRTVAERDGVFKIYSVKD